MFRRNQARTVEEVEPELEVGEAEAAKDEASLEAQLKQLKAVAAEQEARLSKMRASLAQAELLGSRSPDLSKSVLAVAVPEVDVEAIREQLTKVRREALKARQLALGAMRERVSAYRAALTELAEGLKGDEAAVKQLAKEAKKRHDGASAPTVQQPGGEESLDQTLIRAVTQSSEVTAPPVAQADDSSDTAVQRRISPRVQMQAAIDFSSDTNFYNGFSTNISDGGLFIATVAAVPVGTEVEVSFTLPEGQQINAKGEVRWVREVNDDIPDSFPGVGVRFTQLSEDEKAAIAQFVGSRDPLFYLD